MVRLNEEAEQVLSARVARIEGRRQAVLISQQRLKHHLGRELTRPGCLAAVAAAGYLITPRDEADDRLRDERQAYGEELKRALENAALRGAREGAEHSSDNESEDDHGIGHYLVSFATTTAIRFASTWAIQHFTELKGGQSQAEPPGNSGSQNS